MCCGFDVPTPALLKARARFAKASAVEQKGVIIRINPPLARSVGGIRF